jgi:hypothetical protein
MMKGSGQSDVPASINMATFSTARRTPFNK